MLTTPAEVSRPMMCSPSDRGHAFLERPFGRLLQRPNDSTFHREARACPLSARSSQPQSYGQVCPRADRIESAPMAQDVDSDDTRADPAMPTIPGFRFLRLLGQGGMGRVFLAEEAALGRHVAVKLLSGKLSDDPEARARLTTFGLLGQRASR